MQEQETIKIVPVSDGKISVQLIQKKESDGDIPTVLLSFLCDDNECVLKRVNQLLQG